MLNTATPPTLFGLIGHELRWQVLRALARSDMHVNELVDLLQRPQNLVSYHLRKLQAGGILHEQRSIADGRAVYYSLDLENLRTAFAESGAALHPGLDPHPTLKEALMTTNGNPVRVLFLCTHNSARSQIAEGILRKKGGDLLEVHSAGTEETRVHPLAIKAMSQMGIDISSHTSKTLDRFLDQKFDYVITVCDRAKESCPIFPGAPERIHWSFPDPSAVEGSEDQRLKAFVDTAIQMTTRIGFLMTIIQRDHGVKF